jgi:prevent-host-death family protein
VSITTLSSQEFDQDIRRAKQATRTGPVFITARGRPAHVLLTIEEYWRLSGGRMTLADALGQAAPSDFEFDPPKDRGPIVETLGPLTGQSPA